VTRSISVGLTVAAALAAGMSLATCTTVAQAPAGKTAAAPPAPPGASAMMPRPNIPFFDASLPVDRRVEDLLKRLTLPEKVSQLCMQAPAIGRLGIYGYHWWSEALHGIARNGTATVFPQAIGMAASWDTDLHYQMAQVIAVEGRAKHNAAIASGNHGQYSGLDMWSPNINIFRDPRWGRGQETYGEDPYLTSRFGVAFVSGLQGKDPFYFETIATPKHYAVHSGPEPERHRFDVDPSDQDLFTTYLPAFEATVREAHAYSVMAAYNAVDGLPCSANPRLLTDILRRQWGFDGYVVSDVDAVADVYRSHVTVDSPEKAAAISLKAGCDLNGGTTYRSLGEAVRQGLLTEADLDVALRRLFTARIRMGEFDPPTKDPYASIPPTANATDEHDAIAHKMADESMVLLKNENSALPLSKNLQSIAVIGPNADNIPMLYGNYNGTAAHPITIAQGIRNAVPASTHVLSVPGCPLMTEDVPLAEPVSTQFLYTDATRKTHGLLANYYRSITSPDRAVRARIDPTIDLDLPNQMGIDAIPYADGLYVKWSGVLVPPDTGDYQIGFAGKDAFRLTLDGKPVVDQFYAQTRRTTGYAVHLEKDHTYQLLVEFLHPQFLVAAATPPATQTGPDGQPIRLPVATSQPAAPITNGSTQAGGGFTAAPAPGALDELSVQLRWTRPLADGLPAGADGLNLYHDAISAAKSADATVVVLGITSNLEREEAAVHYAGFSGGDRTSLDLPLVQERLLEQVTAAAAGKPLILVINSGSAIAANWASQHVPAILQAWYPGQRGDAVADVLFGDYNPGGRLPVTFYKSVDDLPAFTDYTMKARTYRYFQGQPLYPFGYGLSYTTFDYGDPVVGLPKPGPDYGGDATVSIPVKNTGKVAGDEVVQLYLARPSADEGIPKKSLAGFLRVHLQPGEQKTAQFTLTPYQLSIVNAQGKHAQPGGTITLQVGPNSGAGKTQDLTLPAVNSANEPEYRFVPAKVAG